MKRHASWYLALEKWLLENSNEEYFFTWDIFPTIVCGKHQLLQSEVNLEYLNEIGVELTRRHSGGGCVFADEGDFMFSFIKRNHSENLFKETLTQIVKALDEVGVHAELSGRNDMTFNGRKFSGNAFYKSEKGTIIHGTIMYDVDIEKLVRALTPDDEKLISKGIQSVRQRVINLKPFLNGMSRERLMLHFDESINKPPLDIDYAAVDEIDRYYRSDEWLWGNNPKFTANKSKRFPWGKAEIFLEVKSNVITSVDLRGDFFAIKDLQGLYDELTGKNYSKTTFEKVNLGTYIMGAGALDLAELML